ncbi:MAG: ribbon-helix-helix domain-containing protein [Actinomycetota bacterium]|nr:ribbon-helix-helix domain-containing protein [Actinomycetota bacterium]
MKELRSLVVKLVIGSFSVAALMGIIALLAGGSFGETEGRILLTTVIVGVTSIAVLCYLATAGKLFQVVGLIGGVTVFVPFAVALWLTWFDENGDSVIWRIFGIGVTVSASIAQACLLLALAYDSRPIVRRLLLGTLALIAVIAVLIIIPIVDGSDLTDTYWRFFGVVAILDVLGTITVAALQKFLPEDRQQAGREPLLSTALDSRIADAARARGVSRAELLTEALDKLLGPGN